MFDDWIRISDLKQYVYCPRVIYFTWVVPVKKRTTFGMEHGRIIHDRLEVLEQRRVLSRYGLEHATKIFRRPVKSERYRLVGTVDMLLIDGSKAYPVDFKCTFGPVRKNHRVQLCAYALALQEERFEVPSGFIVLYPSNHVRRVEFTERLKSETERCLIEICRIIETQSIPPPTPHRRKCIDCELALFCGDVY